VLYGSDTPSLTSLKLRVIKLSKGFRLDKAGHGKGGRMRSDVLDHEYSFSLEEAEAWLDAHVK
jgi:hypothetical protein